MGTHPIFESDFDCLTECSELGVVALAFRSLAAEMRLSPATTDVTTGDTPQLRMNSTKCPRKSTSTNLKIPRDGLPRSRLVQKLTLRNTKSDPLLSLPFDQAAPSMAD